MNQTNDRHETAWREAKVAGLMAAFFILALLGLVMVSMDQGWISVGDEAVFSAEADKLLVRRMSEWVGCTTNIPSFSSIAAAAQLPACGCGRSSTRDALKPATSSPLRPQRRPSFIQTVVGLLPRIANLN